MRDQDTIRHFDLLELSLDDYWIIVKCGLLIALLAYIVALFVAAATGTESLLLVTIPPVVGVLYSLGMIWAASRRLTPTQRERLTKQRDLIARRGRMQVAADEATADNEAAVAMMARLRDLVTRMERLHAELLADRIAELETVIGVLEDRTHINQHLLTRCDRECQLLAVEIDVLDIIPSDAREELAARVAEMEALDQELEASQRQRSAEVELDRFLGEAAA
jgi:hypothetical protein